MNTAFRALFWCGTYLLCSIPLASCTYGPPLVEMNIENVRAQPDSHVIAVSVRYRQFRKPAGINTFPNGGTSKILDEKAMIYLCDIDTVEVKRVVSLSPPDSMSISWEPWVLGWANNSLYFKLTGQAGTTLKDMQNKTTVIYKVDLDGNLSEAREIPNDIAFQHNTGPLPQGIFVRVSKGHNDIDIKTESLKDYRTMFKTDNTERALVSIKESNK